MFVLRGQPAAWKHVQAKRMRDNPTPAEALLWSRLKGRGLGVRCYSQVVILGYIADFYVPRWRLVIEVDGSSHRKHKAIVWDRKRKEAMTAIGLKTTRFYNGQIERNLDGVVARIIAISQGATP